MLTYRHVTKTGMGLIILAALNTIVYIAVKFF
ncbi:hypothetical protein J2S17_003090 [Cytobacillus purgationiresistens]|uniref:Uncharacterized protein n=1 Tax=Cytobacillus purgationiresistens TaxID=863449 RepID=A0ABU0AIY2_9BACI|nr:hypothetical protein [Cytobacillus purgationiresistens]